MQPVFRPKIAKRARLRSSLVSALAIIALSSCNPFGFESKVGNGFLPGLDPAPLPTFVDDGASSESLAISPVIEWKTSSTNPASQYQIAIGTCAGCADVKDWADAGTSGLATIAGLSLTAGTRYYASVRAVNSYGISSDAVMGDGFYAVAETPTGSCFFGGTPTGCRRSGSEAIIPFISFNQSIGASQVPGTYFNKEGVLVAARMNFTRQSQTMDNAAWSKAGVVVTANSTTAASGSLAAEKIQRDIDANGGATSLVSQTITGSVCAAGSLVTASLYFKRGDHDIVQMGLRDGATTRYVKAWYNIATGQALSYSVASPDTTLPEYIAHKMTDAGNGWYRAELTMKASTSSCTLTFASADADNSETRAPVNSFFYAWAAQVEDGRGASFFAVAGSSASGIPRFEYDRKTGRLRGLAIESTRTARILYSAEPMNAAFVEYAGLSRVAGSTALDGVSTTALLNDSDAAQNSYLSQPVSPGSPTTIYRICSVFLKRGTSASTSLRIALSGGSTAIAATANVAWADLVLTKSVENASNYDAFLQDLGGGWVRLGVTVQDTFSNTLAGCEVYPAGLVAGGTSTGSVEAWGFQLENEGSNHNSPSSFIPTTSVSISRSTTAVAILDPNNAVGDGAVSLIAVGSPRSTTLGSQALFSFEIDANNTVQIQRSMTNKAIGFQRVSSTNNLNATGAPTFSEYVRMNAAIAWKANDFGFCSRGEAAALTSSTGALFSPTSLRIGTNASSVAFSGWIREFRYYGSRLSNTALCGIVGD